MPARSGRARAAGEGTVCCMRRTYPSTGPPGRTGSTLHERSSPCKGSDPLHGRGARVATLAAAVSADEETPDVDEPQPCTVCRGTGTLISNLGGSPSTVTCAWCEGTGTYL